MIEEEKFDKIIEELGELFNKSEPRTEQQIDGFLSQLKKLWLKHPHQRFAQLLFNYTKMGTPLNDFRDKGGIKNFFNYKDEDVLEGIKNNIEK